MRVLLLGAMLAVALPAMAGVPTGGSAAASPVSTQPLAANEVLLELSALGTATSRADLATLNATLVARGATEAEARRAHQRLASRVAAAARRTGVAAGDIEVGEPVQDAMAAAMDMSMVDVGADTDMADAENAANSMEEAVEAAGAAVDAAADQAETESEIVLYSAVELRLRDPDRVDALREALQEAGAEQISEPGYSGGDQTAARRTARAQALAAARADADAYAASLGLRVARVVRVSERVGMDFSSLMMMGGNSSMMNLFEQQQQQQGPDIPTFVIVGVDFALAPQ